MAYRSLESNSLIILETVDILKLHFNQISSFERRPLRIIFIISSFSWLLKRLLLCLLASDSWGLGNKVSSIFAIKSLLWASLLKSSAWNSCQRRSSSNPVPPQCTISSSAQTNSWISVTDLFMLFCFVLKNQCLGLHLGIVRAVGEKLWSVLLSSIR